MILFQIPWGGGGGGEVLLLLLPRGSGAHPGPQSQVVRLE